MSVLRSTLLVATMVISSVALGGTRELQVILPTGAQKNVNNGTITAFFSFWGMGGQTYFGSGSGTLTWQVYCTNDSSFGIVTLDWTESEQRQAQAKLSHSGGQPISGSARGTGSVASSTLDTATQYQSSTTNINVDINSGPTSTSHHNSWAPLWIPSGGSYYSYILLGTKSIGASADYTRQTHGAGATDGARGYGAHAIQLN